MGGSTNKQRRAKRQREIPKDIEIVDLFEEDTDDDDEIEVLSGPPPQQNFEEFEPLTSPTPPKKKKAKSSKKKDTEDEIVAVGRSNVQRFPHLRQHCTEYPFTIDVKTTHKTNLEKNKKCCTLCFCYVCDAPTADCINWKKHCLASDKGKEGVKWKKMKEVQKKKNDSNRPSLGRLCKK